MTNFSFVRTKEEIANTRKVDSQYRNSEGLFMSWKIDRELFRRVLPPGLEMDEPVITVMVINHGHPGFRINAYTVGMVTMNCHYQDVYGGYPIGFIGQVSDHDDMPIFYGREQYGYPKKNGNVKLERKEDRIYASVRRHGIEVFKSDARITDSTLVDVDDFFPIPELNVASIGAEFHMKYHTECFGDARSPYDSIKYEEPKLVHTQVETIIRKEERAVADVEFAASADDPWIELAPQNGHVNAVYRTFDCCLMSNVLDKRYVGAEEEQILPYLFTGSDYAIFADDYEEPEGVLCLHQ